MAFKSSPNKRSKVYGASSKVSSCQLRLEQTQKHPSPTDMLRLFSFDSHAIQNSLWPQEQLSSLPQSTPCWNLNRKSRFNALSTCEWQLYPQGSLGATLIGPSAPTRFWVGKAGANVWKVLRPAPYEIRRTFFKVYSQRNNAKNCFRNTGLQRQDSKPSVHNNMRYSPSKSIPECIKFTKRPELWTDDIFEPRVGTNSLYGNRTDVSFFLSPHTRDDSPTHWRSGRSTVTEEKWGLIEVYIAHVQSRDISHIHLALAPISFNSHFLSFII